MPQHPLRTAITLMTAAAASLALSAVPAPASDGPADPKEIRDLTTAYVASVKYLDEKAALADGYVPHQCSTDPAGHGSMGYHYFNESRYGSLDPAKPAALLFEDGKDGKRKLAGVEWIVLDSDQNMKTTKDRPSMFGGQKFEGPMPGHYPGMPIHYDLHVWLWKHNPSGLFNRWNPRVKCPAAPAHSSSSGKTPSNSSGKTPSGSSGTTRPSSSGTAHSAH
ncbi:hypothetical protein [Streptomyces rhizosphaerihabitans]|uniref:hypothetical protein n=1 Tax=Streptomyces rhizosphaerihabitans TaxID=1266770 RepID=UPI0021C0C4A7|nr:hypothetical protein [Streptomyces rhizosphaerihabitans]MCT9006557.1 hypothetical protein [Streptomyces rhizosphaerihabitans]